MRKIIFKRQAIQFVAVIFLLATGLGNQARAELPDFTKLVENNSAAVVNISTTQKISKRSLPRFEIPDLPEQHPFGELFRHFFDDGEEMPFSRDARSLGSGFIISSDGYVITNAHVVDDADEIIVRLSDRRELNAELIGTDEQSDLALLKVTAKNLPTLKLGSSKDLKVGEWVLAIGTPFGFEHSATAGIVSAKGRSLPNENYVPFIQTDVAINPGNSGGPLFNTKGEVVGVNSQIYSGTGGYMGLSFAIPIEVAQDVVEQLKSTGHVSRGWLGVLIQDVTPELARSFGMDNPGGALVARVLEGSPAQAADVHVGDVIVKFNGHDIRTSASLPPLVGRLHANEIVKMTVIRDGKRKTITVKIGDLPDEDKAVEVSSSQKKDSGSRLGRLGITVNNLTSDIQEETGIKHGVVISDVDEGPASDVGLLPGDVIQMIDNKKIQTTRQFKEIVDSFKAGQSVAILVYRETGPAFLAIRIPE
ncbi:MAG: DegQ family serine endoprotease [Gammaproteobacteria bacterium]|nr:MAG: DegQ family serine endoprotease [Gammaproteobacteria bacterium]